MSKLREISSQLYSFQTIDDIEELLIRQLSHYFSLKTTEKTILKKGVTLGANSTIICGNTIGEHALIGAGTVICKCVEPYSIMVGNPGKKIGNINEKGGRIIYKN